MIVRTVYVCWHTRAPSPRVVEPQTPRKKLVFRYEGVRDSKFPLYNHYYYYYYALQHS